MFERRFLSPWNDLLLTCLPLTSYPLPHPQKHGLFQPRSQGLSSLPPLVVGTETLVAAGHVTTQNLGGSTDLKKKTGLSNLLFSLLQN